MTVRSLKFRKTFERFDCSEKYVGAQTATLKNIRIEKKPT